MRRLTIFLTTFSLAGCGVPRPDTDLCIVNAPGGYLRCYNAKRDYDDSGNKKKDAKPTFRFVSKIEDVNKFLCTDPVGAGNLKQYIKDLREAAKK